MAKKAKALTPTEPEPRGMTMTPTEVDGKEGVLVDFGDMSDGEATSMTVALMLVSSFARAMEEHGMQPEEISAINSRAAEIFNSDEVQPTVLPRSDGEAN